MSIDLCPHSIGYRTVPRRYWALCAQPAEARALDTLRAFHRDRPAYRQEQVDQGLAESDALWTETEAAQESDQDRRREAGKLDA